MKKKIGKKEEVTNKDLAQMLGSMNVGLNSKIDNLGKTLDIRITRLESYMKEGFNSLDSKIDHIDTRLHNYIEGLNRRMDDFALFKKDFPSYNILSTFRFTK